MTKVIGSSVHRGLLWAQNNAMGIIGFFKKEKYINRLVKVYKIAYDCDDYGAIDALRRNYTQDQLKSVLDYLSHHEKSLRRERISMKLTKIHKDLILKAFESPDDLLPDFKGMKWLRTKS